MGAAGGITGMKSCGLKGWLRDDADGRRVGGASRRGGGGLGDRARKEMKRSALPSWEGSGKPFPAKFLLLRKSGGSRNSVGIAIQLSDSKEKELFVHDSMQVSPE